MSIHLLRLAERAVGYETGPQLDPVVRPRDASEPAGPLPHDVGTEVPVTPAVTRPPVTPPLAVTARPVVASVRTSAPEPGDRTDVTEPVRALQPRPVSRLADEEGEKMARTARRQSSRHAVQPEPAPRSTPLATPRSLPPFRHGPPVIEPSIDQSPAPTATVQPLPRLAADRRPVEPVPEALLTPAPSPTRMVTAREARRQPPPAPPTTGRPVEQPRVSPPLEPPAAPMAANVPPSPTVTIGHLDIDLVPAPSAKPAPGARRPQPPRAIRGLPARNGFRYGFGQL